MTHIETDNRPHGEQALAVSTKEAHSQMADEIYMRAPRCIQKGASANSGIDWLPTIQMSEPNHRDTLRNQFEEKAKECRLLAKEQAKAQQQIVDLDAIDPAQLSQDAQFGGPVGNWFRYLGRATCHAIDGMAQTGTTDDLIFGSIVRAKHYYSDHSLPTVVHDFNNLFHDATGAVLHSPETVKNMTDAQRSKASAEFVLNAFFLLGAKTPVACEKAEQLGLKYLSEEQLENLRYERCDVPKLKLVRDEFSMQAFNPGDSRAYVRIEVSAPGAVNVTSIDRGELRDGMGGDLLAQALNDFGQRPTKRLCFSGIINAPTKAAYESGFDAANSVLGKTGRRTLELLGLKAKDCRFEKVGDKVNLVIDVE